MPSLMFDYTVLPISEVCKQKKHKKRKKEISTKILHVVVLIFLDTTCSIALSVDAFVGGRAVTDVVLRKKDELIDIALAPFRMEISEALRKGDRATLVCTVSVHGRSLSAVGMQIERYLKAPSESIDALKNNVAKMLK